MPLHQIVVLRDGRAAIADYRQPINHVMHKVNAWLMEEGHGGRSEPPPKVAEAYAVIGRWLDAHPEQACTHEQMRTDTCTHPPATADPYRPPPYRESAGSRRWGLPCSILTCERGCSDMRKLRVWAANLLFRRLIAGRRIEVTVEPAWMIPGAWPAPSVLRHDGGWEEPQP